MPLKIARTLNTNHRARVRARDRDRVRVRGRLRERLRERGRPTPLAQTANSNLLRTSVQKEEEGSRWRGTRRGR